MAVVFVSVPPADSSTGAGAGGTVVAWGFNLSGQTDVPAGLDDVVAVTGISGGSLALRSDGSLVAWGSLGQDAIPAGIGTVTDISAGISHYLALRSDGTVAAWGANDRGQTTIPAGLTDVVAISAGAWHNLAVKGDGTVVAWGQNTDGQASVPSGLTGVVDVDAGTFHSLALRSNGTVAAWGSDNWGETDVPPGLTDVTAVAAGLDGSLALRANGSVVDWGYVFDDDPDIGGTNMPPGLNGVTSLSANEFARFALKNDGSIVAWGYPTWGQLDVPPGLTDVVTVTAAPLHALAIVAADTTAPEASAALVPVDVPDRGRGVFEVAASCIDDTDPEPTVEVSLNGIAVSDGDEVVLVPSGHTGAEVRDGTLYVWGQVFTLDVDCEDAAGNDASASAQWFRHRPSAA